MKKWMVIELIVLAVLLVAAIVTGFILAGPVLFPDKPDETTASISTEAPLESTAESVPESTGETATETTTESTEETGTEATQESTAETAKPKPTEPTPTVKPTAPTPPPPTEATQPEPPASTEATTPAPRQITARQYFIYDCNTNTFIATLGQPDDRVYPASITKLLTIHVALQYLTPETAITAGEELNMVSWDSSIAKIKAGDVLTVQQLIAGMLLPSGNDAAHVIACYAGRMIAQNPALEATAAVQVFVDAMNTHAAQLGMTGSHFMNPDGMHNENHYTCFADLVILGKLSMGNPLIMQYAATPGMEVPLHGENILWKNTNQLINPGSSHYCPYAVGLKTGRTDAAGNCLLSAYLIDDQQLLIGVFGAPSEKDRFEDTLQLFNQWFLS